MSDNSAIQWTEATWNPTTGCDRVSAGCDNCYALALAARLKAMGQPRYQTDGDPRTSGPGFGISMHPDALDAPLRWRKPRRVFVNSMSDLFHPQVTDDFIADVWAVMARTPQHTYQILTKRAPRMASLMPEDPFDGGYRLQAAATTEEGAQALYDCEWPLPNVHLGVSVETQRYADERIPRLRKTAAAVRFLSCEPLLGPVPDLDLTGIGWVIIGGESGTGARGMSYEWAADIASQCRKAGVPAFVKQLGTVLGGRRHHDIATFPAELRVREYPADRTAVTA